MKQTLLAALTGILLALPASAEQPLTEMNHCNGRVQAQVQTSEKASELSEQTQKPVVYTSLRVIKASSIQPSPEVQADASQSVAATPESR